jgi:hypothetical protein
VFCKRKQRKNNFSVATGGPQPASALCGGHKPPLSFPAQPETARGLPANAPLVLAVGLDPTADRADRWVKTDPVPVGQTLALISVPVTLSPAATQGDPVPAAGAPPATAGAHSGGGSGRRTPSRTFSSLAFLSLLLPHTRCVVAGPAPAGDPPATGGAPRRCGFFSPGLCSLSLSGTEARRGNGRRTSGPCCQ